MNILIIEDELPAARRLERLVLSLRPHWRVVRHLDSVEETIEFFQSGEKPNLAFMDIQLADGLSFDIFKKCDVCCPVVFTTAFDHYAVKAFKVNSIDYLLKPVDDTELANAIHRFEMRSKNTESPLDDLKLVLSDLKTSKPAFRQRFLVRTAGRLAFIPVTEVAYLFSDEGNTFVVTKKNDRFLIESTIEETESELPPDHFFRINRKMVICLSSIVRIEPYLSNRYLLSLSPEFGEDVVVSRQRSSEFRNWLDR